MINYIISFRPMASLCRNLYSKKPPINTKQYHLSICPRHPSSKLRMIAPAAAVNIMIPNVISVRTIVINEKLIERGVLNKFGSGFSKEGGLDNFGTFPEMEEFMVNDVPDLLVNVVTTLPELSMFNAWPTTVIAHTFDNFQAMTGISWLASIGVIAALTKLSMYPFHIWWRKEFQEHVKASPIQIANFLKTYFENVIKSGSEEGIKLAYMARAATCTELNLPLYPNLVPIYATILTPLVAVLGLSYLTNLTYEPLMTGGIFWFPNLAEPDPYCILPVLNSILIIANTRFHPFGLLLPKPIYGLQFAPPLVILAMSQLWFSSAVLVYWMSANFVGLIIQLLLRKPAIREYHGLESKIQVFEPLLKHSPSLVLIGNQIEATRTELLAIKKEELKLIKEMNSMNSNQSEELEKANENRLL